MATDITMPKLSDTMTEGRLVSWKKSVGEQVHRGEIIAEVETDKANMELEAFTSGVLLQTFVKPGDLVAVGTVIAAVGAAGDQATGGPAPAAAPEIGPEKLLEVEEPPAAAAPPPAAAAPAPLAPVEPTPATPAAGEERAAPAVRRKARELGIDLALVPGSGPGGRILLNDLERFTGVHLGSQAGEGLPPQPATPTPEEPAPAAGQVFQGAPPVAPADQEQPVSRMRAAIARTVNESWQTIPHIFLTVEIDMAAAEEIHRQLKGAGLAVTLNDLVVKGAALAIARYPQVNATFAGEKITVHREVNIGFAVGLPDGLLVPVVKGCQALSLKEIAGRCHRLIERARGGQISEADLAGGTFSVSNLGMFGVHQFTALIPPHQAAIVAVGAVTERPVVRQGQLAVGRIMAATLCADHRIIDGAYAAQFMGELKRILESPATLLL